MHELVINLPVEVLHGLFSHSPFFFFFAGTLRQALEFRGCNHPSCEVLSSGGRGGRVRNVLWTFLQASKVLPEPRRFPGLNKGIKGFEVWRRTSGVVSRHPAVRLNADQNAANGRPSVPPGPPGQFTTCLYASFAAVTFSRELLSNESRCCSRARKQRSLCVNTVWALGGDNAVIYGANFPRLLPAQHDTCLEAPP